ncbi:MAG: DUF2501 domain-containing protein [Yokenella regensburgei]|jgi:hypothetical protein|uniref:Protein of uncharacterized function (DUF2501) n=1 Tax=Yokenella regensburgei TaxID=158877 RepID=A0AB38FW98_9ENTR|nr:DUF2501 domain-containing protein [Yokenella regensburgei]EHM51364.1 hypothetical protein HMPREF0880_00485 [Yokenella regensburgei ATCC 43003]KAF1370809.1 hypothetical protein FHR25_000904 [Yokenella regensburgei]KFD25188.1 putative glycoprotein/receptor [Yokenella regensburgei ATCC 49455]MDQ4429411.1 DUF2501 domain-containing protein [Yokenella regensburgei]MDR2216942.1 DUF2501 domain-containing protein [Yokenella regensburgei]
MNTVQRLICSAIAGAALLSSGAFAASWQDSLNSAANELTKSTAQSGTTSQSGMSLSSLTSLLNGNGQALSANNMNNAAGILQYCAKQKLASATNVDNVKNQVLDKLGLGAAEQKKDTNYLDGIQGLLNAQNGQQLDLNSLGSSPLAEKVKTKACDMVLKQGASFLS